MNDITFCMRPQPVWVTSNGREQPCLHGNVVDLSVVEPIWSWSLIPFTVRYKIASVLEFSKYFQKHVAFYGMFSGMVFEEVLPVKDLVILTLSRILNLGWHLCNWRAPEAVLFTSHISLRSQRQAALPYIRSLWSLNEWFFLLLLSNNSEHLAFCKGFLVILSRTLSVSMVVVQKNV